MATKNCPKCDSPNPVACKKCACGHVFFVTRRSANAIAAEAEDISEPTTPQEPEQPRRRTARVTRERPQFYDALQVENQTRRQRELQKRRKASKSDDAEAAVEEIPEKASVSQVVSKRRAESPPPKAAEPTPKKRRGRPPGLTSRRSGRAQILASKPTDNLNKVIDGQDGHLEGELESVSGMHDVPPLKALQMNMVLADINSRISSSSVKADEAVANSVDVEVEGNKPEAVEEEPEEVKPPPEKTRSRRKQGKETITKEVQETKVKKEVDESEATEQMSSTCLEIKKETSETDNESSKVENEKAVEKVEAMDEKLDFDLSKVKPELSDVDDSGAPVQKKEDNTPSVPEANNSQSVCPDSKGCAFPC